MFNSFIYFYLIISFKKSVVTFNFMKVYVKTYGCTHNKADSEVMAGLLDKAGYELVDDESADLLLINTCTVKDPSEKKFYSELKRIEKPVVVAGCIPQSDKRNSKLKNCSLLGVNQIHKVVEVVDKTLNGEIVHLLQRKSDLNLILPKIRKNPLVEIIPISSGCMGSCTFCKTKQARGGVKSFSEEEIIKQIRLALNDGIKELWLTSEDSGAYGLDIGTTLPELLKKILKIPKDFRMRLGMTNPEYVYTYANELVEIFKDERMFKFLHVPVQSGNDEVLKLMVRPYTVEQFKESVNKIKKAVPNITIATDIICGFPGETEEAFEDTINLLKEMKIPVVNISKFYPRPDTPAAKMKLIPTHVVKSRSKSLTDFNETNISNEEWLDWNGSVLVDDVGKNGDFIGRNDYYKPVIVSGDDLLGKRVDVKIIEVFRDYLKGKLIN